MLGKLAFSIVFLAVLAIPIHAETMIDAQPQTQCIYDKCQTLVNLKDFMKSGQITALKAIDLTPAKPAITEHLVGFDYQILANDSILFTGTVAKDSQVYWSFNLLGSTFVIDPWWNYTYNQTGTLNYASCSATDYLGTTITFNDTVNLTRVCKEGTNTASKSYLINNTSYTQLAQAYFSADNCSYFNNSQFKSGDVVAVLMGSDGGAYCRGYFTPWSGATDRYFVIANDGAKNSSGSYGRDANYYYNVRNITVSNWTEPVPEPPPITNFTYSICTDNETLYNHYTAFVNGSFNYTDVYLYCHYGCDNVSMSCQLPTYQSNLLLFGVMCVACIIGYFIVRRLI